MYDGACFFFPPRFHPQAAVPDAIKALKDKKAWFSEQPRQPMTAGKPVQVNSARLTT